MFHPRQKSGKLRRGLTGLTPLGLSHWLCIHQNSLLFLKHAVVQRLRLSAAGTDDEGTQFQARTGSEARALNNHLANSLKFIKTSTDGSLLEDRRLGILGRRIYGTPIEAVLVRQDSRKSDSSPRCAYAWTGEQVAHRAFRNRPAPISVTVRCLEKQDTCGAWAGKGPLHALSEDCEGGLMSGVFYSTTYSTQVGHWHSLETLDTPRKRMGHRKVDFNPEARGTHRFPPACLTEVLPAAYRYKAVVSIRRRPDARGTGLSSMGHTFQPGKARKRVVPHPVALHAAAFSVDRFQSSQGRPGYPLITPRPVSPVRPFDSGLAIFWPLQILFREVLFDRDEMYVDERWVNPLQSFGT
ncbi:hypothetical protein C8R47DRAFT_1201104 [Mycena vitilis]|nr:hypothetical protein C8R47DRAFT_1201104 [Mycena vitilis]